MSARKLGVVLTAVFAALLIVPVAASAQSAPAPVPVSSFSHVPVSGTAANGKAFTGHFNVTQFVTRHGKSYALGTLTGKLGNRTVSRPNVAIPVSSGSATSTTGLSKDKVASPAATCPILHLDLGPLNLNLLGLTVHLNQVVLDINAVSGPGNLLGNLLCSVANLLNQAALPTSQLTALLNILQQLLNVPALASV
jgi:hypothetical protein